MIGAARYFAPTMWAPTYWAKLGAEQVLPPVVLTYNITVSMRSDPIGSGTSIRSDPVSEEA